MKKLFIIIPAALILTLALGCGDPHRHADHGHAHHHEPPHGGTPVVLGDAHFHLEFVRDSETGAMTAYVLDGHLHDFIRIRERSFDLHASFNGRHETLVFRPVADPRTGEIAGDTSRFETEAEWLKSTAEFEAVIPRIEVREILYENVRFNFPEGHEVHSH